MYNFPAFSQPLKWKGRQDGCPGHHWRHWSLLLGDDQGTLTTFRFLWVLFQEHAVRIYRSTVKWASNKWCSLWLSFCGVKFELEWCSDLSFVLNSDTPVSVVIAIQNEIKIHITVGLCVWLLVTLFKSSGFTFSFSYSLQGRLGSRLHTRPIEDALLSFALPFLRQCIWNTKAVLHVFDTRDFQNLLPSVGSRQSWGLSLVGGWQV